MRTTIAGTGIGHQGSRPTRAVPLLAGLALTALFLLLQAATAGAYEIKDFSANIVKQDGTTFESQAGGHPYQGIISFNTKTLPSGENDGFTKTIRLDTPPGLVPNPEAVPKCTQTQLEANACPADSQVGVSVLRLRSFLPSQLTAAFNITPGTRGAVRLTTSLYNMETEGPDQLARFSFNPAQAGAPGHIVDIIGDMRAQDNGLFFTIFNVSRPTPTDPTAATLTGATLTFWGTPGDPSHNPARGAALLQLTASDAGGGYVGPQNPPNTPPPGTPLTALLPYTLGGHAGGQTASNPNVAFLSNPTSCAGPQNARLTLDSYAGDQDTSDFEVGGPPNNGLIGCDQVPFSSTTSFGTSSLQRDAPVPLGVTLDVPQTSDVGTLATAHVKKVSVTLPPGMTISPSAANGLEACSDAQFGQGTSDAIACPAASKIGVVSIKSPVLANALQGDVYVGQPLPGNRYRLFLNADGYGISIRLKGTVLPDAKTGQVTAVFDDNPQLPFSQFKLDFDGGSKAIIASPQTCGVATGSSSLSPWSGGEVSTTKPAVEISGCNGFPFAPGFGATAGTLRAGAFTPLLVDFTRPDGDQFLSDVGAALPPGMLAKIKGVTQCSEAQVAAEACPASSRIGTVSVKAGPGATPYALSGPVYLTGPYNHGSFGTVVIIHAVAGPYDLGNVVVRQSLRVDPNTAQVTIASDPLPQIKEGIVLRLREMKLDVNRAGFMRNPTSCGAGKIGTDLTSAGGARVTRSADLRFFGCTDLAFKPKIKMALRNRSQMRKFRHPQVRADVTQPDNQSAIRNVRVLLPRALALAADNAQGLCEVADAAKDKCPKASMVGWAEAVTPVLNRSLKGPVYFVKGERTSADGRIVKTLPTLYVPLRGEVQINLRATTAVSNKRLVTRFSAIPDAPMSKFRLVISGGKHGIIAATQNLCPAKGKKSRTLRAIVRLSGQNSKRPTTQKPALSRACR